MHNLTNPYLKKVFKKDKKIFYGENILLHWIRLILKHNIVLSEYQSGFVWPKENVESIVSFLQGWLFCSTSG